jgi:hypothetical protein
LHDYSPLEGGVEEAFIDEALNREWPALAEPAVR